MDAQKWIGWSKTVWGVIIMVVSNLLPVIVTFFGADIDPTEVAAVGTSGTAVIETIGVFIGATLAVYGRYTAEKTVTVLPA